MKTPTWCNNLKYFISLDSSLYMFRVLHPPIIRSFKHVQSGMREESSEIKYWRLLHQVGVFIYWYMMHGTVKLKFIHRGSCWTHTVHVCAIDVYWRHVNLIKFFPPPPSSPCFPQQMVIMRVFAGKLQYIEHLHNSLIVELLLVYTIIVMIFW